MNESHSHDLWAERLTEEELTVLLEDRKRGVFLANHDLQRAQYKLDRLEREKARRDSANT